MKKLYFIRHGESVYNRERRFAGHANTPLTSLGREQARQAGQAAKKIKIDLIISSPLSRALETAKILAAEIGYPQDKIEVNPLLIERNYGALEGEYYGPDIDMDGIADIETSANLLSRAAEAIDSLKQISVDNVLIVCHGGVDSMTLLDILVKKPRLELVVAHFEHGIRAESADDEALVRRLAKQLDLAYEVGYGKLGPRASEAKARAARYKFLEAVRRKHFAKAVLTAHHQDDLIETALINLLRGTSWRGLHSVQNDGRLQRPLLQVTKRAIRQYAKKTGIEWHEDASNQNERYLRNYLRLNIIPKLSVAQRRFLISKIDTVAKNKSELAQLIATISQLLLKDNIIERSAFCQLPNQVSRELVVEWLTQLKTTQVDKKTIDRLDLTLRAGLPGRSYTVDSNWALAVSKSGAQFIDQ